MNQLYTLPNLLTLLRLLICPFYLWLFFQGYRTKQQDFLWLGISGYLLVILLDVVDGMVARKLNQVTTLGSILDPLIDFIIRFSTLVTYYFLNLVPLWLPCLYTGFFIEYVIDSNLIQKQARSFSFVPSYLGKRVAELYQLTIGLVMVNQFFKPPLLQAKYLSIFYLILAVLTIISIFDRIRLVRRYWRSVS